MLCPSPWALRFQGISVANKSDPHRKKKKRKKRLQNCFLKLLPNCAEEGEYKKTGKLVWTQRAFWSLRPFLRCSWQSNPCLNHALYFRERSHCEKMHLFPRVCSELERLRQTGRAAWHEDFLEQQVEMNNGSWTSPCMMGKQGRQRD